MMWKMCRSITIAGPGLAVGLLMLASVSLAVTTSGNKPLPKFEQVEKTVVGYFDRLKGYKSGEILSRGLVEPVFRDLERIGWKVAGRKAVLDDVLPDNNTLVKQLRTPAGKKFARQVAKVPQGYDRLYRLSLLPRGRQNVQNLIVGPDGYLMIEYMTTTPEGKNLGGMLSRDPQGKKFNKPTKLIFTVDDLVERLKQEYAVATGAKGKPNAQR